jgi:Ca2+-binding RTX toxin-like protein
MRTLIGSRIGLLAAIAGVIALLGVSFATAKLIGGSSGPDTLRGTDRGELIVGHGGNDSINGRGGHDRLLGGDGSDRVIGGSGTDRIRGGDASDRIRGGGGGDVLYGGRGRDEFNTRNGVLLGSPGNDVIHARDFKADEIDCDTGWDKVFVDGIEDGVYNCERIITVNGEIGHHVPPPDDGEGGSG